LSNMLKTLRDGHVNLTAPFNRSRYWDWYLNAPDNYDQYLLERHYFKDEQQYIGSFTVMDFGDVGYIHYESFSDAVDEDALDIILEQFKDHKGLIFDVRNNFGGSLSNVYTLGARFAKNGNAVALQKQKNGRGHNDFTDYDSLRFTPTESISFTKPIVVLTNRKTYSAGTFFSTLMQALPHVTVMGDRTGGGGGAPAFTELTNGWTLRVSTTQLFTLNEFNVEDGLFPDIKVDNLDTDIAENRDRILETALEHLR
ncbi:MAG: S41 family peptidase, partial [Bacteroidetes bacterium]|nr:S41 family peptidase [Bacteroidota bacterium]